MIRNLIKMCAWVVFGGFLGFGLAWPIGFMVESVAPGIFREGAGIVFLFIPIVLLGCLLGFFLGYIHLKKISRKIYSKAYFWRIVGVIISVSLWIPLVFLLRSKFYWLFKDEVISKLLLVPMLIVGYVIGVILDVYHKRIENSKTAAAKTE